MIHFNCRCNPIGGDRFKEAIRKWAKDKGIDPEHVFTANSWDMPGGNQWIYGDPSIPLDMIVKGPINASVFEEAIIEDETFPVKPL
jgi:hypothetical protein